MGQTALGEFEHHVLLSVLRLGADAYSVAIYNQLEERIGRDISLAAVYVALRRLEKRGLVKSWITEPTGGVGHRRRYVRLTSQALLRMRESRKAFLTLWDGVEPLLDEQ